jgi:hypothetical protein
MFGSEFPFWIIANNDERRRIAPAKTNVLLSGRSLARDCHHLR